MERTHLLLAVVILPLTTHPSRDGEEEVGERKGGGVGGRRSTQTLRCEIVRTICYVITVAIAREKEEGPSVDGVRGPDRRV